MTTWFRCFECDLEFTVKAKILAETSYMGATWGTFDLKPTHCPHCGKVLNVR